MVCKAAKNENPRAREYVQGDDAEMSDDAETSEDAETKALLDKIETKPIKAVRTK
jgi:hypothetical protein